MNHKLRLVLELAIIVFVVSLIQGLLALQFMHHR